jgi:hypothetical protein
VPLEHDKPPMRARLGHPTHDRGDPALPSSSRLLQEKRPPPYLHPPAAMTLGLFDSSAVTDTARPHPVAESVFSLAGIRVGRPAEKYLADICGRKRYNFGFCNA